jgi:5,10-methylenetetrahydromethanopterin reductase
VPVSPFGIRVPPCAALAEVARCIAGAEAMGYGTAWVPDSQFLFRDPWMALSAAGSMTDRIRLAIGVTNLKTRHPTVTAAALQTLEESTPGRTVVGLGTGDSSVKCLGWTPSRLSEVEDGVQALRRLSRGESIDIGDRSMRLRDATDRVPPVFLAASGPRALRLAGRIADGVLLMAGTSTSLVARALALVDQGLEESGRCREDIEICLGAVCHVAEDETDIVRIAKPHCAGDAQRGGRPAFAQAGVRLQGEVPQFIPDVSPDITHADDWDVAVRVAGRWIDDQAALRYAENFTFVATPEELIERFGVALDAGVDSFYLRHYKSYVLPDDLIADVGKEVLPRIPV